MRVLWKWSSLKRSPNLRDEPFEVEERKWSRQSFVSGVDQSSLGIPKFTENIVENLTRIFIHAVYILGKCRDSMSARINFKYL